MLQKKLKIVVIESCYGRYQNPWYWIKKNTPGKYQLVNIIEELNWITIRDINLSLFANKFSKEFARYTILFFIDFFSGYD